MAGPQAPAGGLAASPYVSQDGVPAPAARLSILLVEDDVDLAQMLVEFMSDDAHAITLAHDGVAALALLLEQPFDLVVLDVMLPRADGFELLQALRRRSHVPVIMMTARTAAADRISGLELGADDYLCKPVDPLELMARIRAVLRRTQVPSRETPVEPDATALGPLRVVPSSQRATLSGVDLGLTAAELRVLDMLVRQAGTPVSREQLTELALGRSLEAYDRSLDTHVSNLRRKLRRAGEFANAPEASLPEIRGLRSFGYVLTAGASTPGPFA
ncbi:DNA-binding response regulator [Pigmentiphaga litoralis]|uniref:response regulator transcription factor n=1 Tax=Pigmentiphaga litoralis TaxID=516702 RepID=UPI00167A6EDD|nr:response regulator transcription factor [Pigmentiphaga litoralis]GGX21108.1 DNA-binding response regulator [Pigmentiphaga litoralis]